MITTPLNIKAEIRNDFGSKKSKAIRKEKKVPAVLYNKGIKPHHIKVPIKEINKVYLSGLLYNTKINISTKEKSFCTIVKEAHFHPVTDEIIHLDFTLLENIFDANILLPLKVVGKNKSNALKRGGIVNHINRKILVNCNIDNIPQNIEVDISHLEVKKTLKASELKIPQGCKIAVEKKYPILSILGKDNSEEDKKTE